MSKISLEKYIIEYNALEGSNIDRTFLRKIIDKKFREEIDKTWSEGYGPFLLTLKDLEWDETKADPLKDIQNFINSCKTGEKKEFTLFYKPDIDKEKE